MAGDLHFQSRVRQQEDRQTVQVVHRLALEVPVVVLEEYLEPDRPVDRLQGEVACSGDILLQIRRNKHLMRAEEMSRRLRRQRVVVAAWQHYSVAPRIGICREGAERE